MSSTASKAQSQRRSQKVELFLGTLRGLPQLRALGWGLLVAWGTISTFTDVFAPADMQSFRDYWIANMATTTIGLVGFGFFWHPKEKTFAQPSMLVAAVLIVASTVVMAFWYTGASLEAHTIQIIAGILSGLGMAMGTLCWGMYYARQDASVIETQVICSLALMTVFYGLALVSSWIVKVCLLVVLPLGSSACFSLCQDGRDRESASDEEVVLEREGGSCVASVAVGASGAMVEGRQQVCCGSHALLLELCRVGVGVIAAGCAVSLTWSLISEGIVPLEGSLFAASLLSGAFVTVALLINCITFANRLNHDSLFRWLLPLIVLSLFFLVGSNQIVWFIGSMGILAAQMGLDAFTLILFCERASYRKGEAALIIGLGRGFLQGGIFAGALVAGGVVDIIAAGNVSLPETLLCLTAVLTGCVMFSLTGSLPPSGLQRKDVPIRTHVGVERQLAFPEDANELERVLFERKCDCVAGSGNLSQRERELLSYLARGRSLPYIRNELFISKSTVNTHVEHIYSKLGIHSREELISLVEEAPADLNE